MIIIGQLDQCETEYGELAIQCAMTDYCQQPATGLYAERAGEPAFDATPGCYQCGTDAGWWRLGAVPDCFTHPGSANALGQIMLDGKWADYARGTLSQSLRWFERERRQGRQARVVDWIDRTELATSSGCVTL